MAGRFLFLDPKAQSALTQELTPGLNIPPDYIPDPSRIKQLAWKPRAFLYPNFLSAAECDYIVNMSRPLIGVVDSGGAGREERGRHHSNQQWLIYCDPCPPFFRPLSPPFGHPVPSPLAPCPLPFHPVSLSAVAPTNGAVDSGGAGREERVIKRIEERIEPVTKRIEEHIGDWTFLPLGKASPSLHAPYSRSPPRAPHLFSPCPHQDPVIMRIEERIGDWTFLPL
ncbi:unnamed protein product, partial [Closterium sp. NIES-65]